MVRSMPLQKKGSIKEDSKPGTPLADILGVSRKRINIMIRFYHLPICNLTLFIFVTCVKTGFLLTMT